MLTPVPNAALSDVMDALENKRDIWRIFAKITMDKEPRLLYAMNLARA